MGGGSQPQSTRRYEPYPSAREKTWDGTFTKPRKKWVEEDKSNDWLCGTCNINNFAKRTSCFRCHREKSECEVTKREGGEEKGGTRAPGTREQERGGTREHDDEVTIATAD